MIKPNAKIENDPAKLLKLCVDLVAEMWELWFMVTEETFGHAEAVKLEVKAWEEYFRVFAERMKQLITSDGPALEVLSQLIQLDPIFCLSGCEISHLSKNRMFLRINKCLLLEIAEHSGRGAHRCETAEIVHFGNLAKEVNPNVTVHVIKLPPRNSPDEACCEWLFEINDV
jgi:hypothetical protein